MDKLNSLTIFIRAASVRSFSVAARQLGLSPSAVSKAVQRLEDRLGTRLLHRTTRRIALTEDGAAFYERCRRILEELEEVEQELTKSDLHPKGTLRVDLNASFGLMYIVPALPEFTERYQDLKLDISFSDRHVDLYDEPIDVVVSIESPRETGHNGHNGHNGLIEHQLATSKLIVCAAPNYLKRHGIPETPQDLRHHNCLNLIYPQTKHTYEWCFQQNGRAFYLPVEGNMQFDRPEALLEAAIAEAGIIVVPSYIATKALSEGLLEQILQGYDAPRENIAVNYLQKHHLSAKVRVFVDFMDRLMNKLREQQIVA